MWIGATWGARMFPWGSSLEKGWKTLPYRKVRFGQKFDCVKLHHFIGFLGSLLKRHCHLDFWYLGFDTEQNAIKSLTDVFGKLSL